MMTKRGWNVVIRMLDNVQQETIRPLLTAVLTPGTLVYTDEYDIIARLLEWGYGHIVFSPVMQTPAAIGKKKCRGFQRSFCLDKT